MIEVTCKNCAITKPLSEFYKKAKSLTGIRSVCKQCCSSRLTPAEQISLTCRRCGIDYTLWNSTLKKRIERKHPFPTACEDCYERPTTDWVAVWDYYAKVKGITN
jgi:hypothetical protein